MEQKFVGKYDLPEDVTEETKNLTGPIAGQKEKKLSKKLPLKKAPGPQCPAELYKLPNSR